jgi:acetyl esterase/lipase
MIIVIVNSNKKPSDENKQKDSTDSDSTYIDTDEDKIVESLPYDVNGLIENSFKNGGDNYNGDIGNINNGSDYEKNDRNIYDLYIPKKAKNRKNEVNGIILWIHGGSWIGGDLKEVNSLCEFTNQIGYISANVEYTILSNTYKTFNIFRILDEITASIKAIKKELKKRGFNENKLKLAIGGYSAGGHIVLLYSYLIKDIDIIPIQFVVDFVGPIGLDPKYFYMLNPL